jgi:hypothetical protein
MKKIILSICVLLNIVWATAQKIEIGEDDVVTKDGIPYCKIIKEGTALMPIISFENFDGDALLKIEPNIIDGVVGCKNYKVSFDGLDENEAFLTARIPVVKNFVKDIVTANLLKDNMLDEATVTKFCNAHKDKTLPKDKTEKAEKPERIVKEKPERAEKPEREEAIEKPIKEQKFKIVDRNLEMPILIQGLSITQDNKTIGRYSRSTGNVNNKAGFVIFIYNTENRKVAVAKYATGADEAKIVTTKDGETMNIGIIANDDVKAVELIIRVLVDSNYL